MEIRIFDEHHEVLADWWERSVRDATVVFFDAHLDLQFISEATNRASEASRFCQRGSVACEAPPSFPGSRGYSFGIEDFLYAASELGIVRRVIWVAPPHVLSESVAAALEQLCQVDGVALADLNSFRLTVQATQIALCYD